MLNAIPSLNSQKTKVGLLSALVAVTALSLPVLAQPANPQPASPAMTPAKNIESSNNGTVATPAAESMTPAKTIEQQSEEADIKAQAAEIKPATGVSTAKGKPPQTTAGAISRVAQAGLMSGYPDGKFHAEGHVTRAELAHILVKTFNVGARQPQDAGANTMSDVPKTHWAYSDINTALKTNVMEGYRPGRFYPNQAVTRGEGFAILAQAYGVFDFNDTQVQETLAEYKDVSQLPQWSTKAMATAIHEGFVNTNENTGYIYPDKPLTRGDLAYALSRYLDRTDNEFPNISPNTGEK